MASKSIFGAAGRALQHAVYRRYMIGHTLSATGRWMKRTAVGWVAWELTHSATWLGIVAFADLFPMMIFVILSGAIADRVGLMRIVKLSQILSSLIAFVFAALIFTDLITIEAVVVLSVCFGAAEALSQPARMAAVHGMVPREDLSAAIAIGGATFNASRIVGPAIAGGLIIWVNSGTVIALCGVIFFIFYLLLRTIEIAESGPRQQLSFELFVDIWRGMQYVHGNTGIRFLITLMVSVSLLMRPVMELMPGVSDQIFNAGPAGLSLLLGSIGGGALLASLWLARRGEMAGLTNLVTLSILGCGLALALAMAFGHLWVAVGFLMVTGACMLTGNVGAQSLIQNTVDAHIRARVLSLFIVFAHGLPAIGALLIGWIASHAGLQWTLTCSGLILAVVWLWGRMQTRGMAKILEKAD
ncbi:MAG: MFS transporter [Alphaproteobacteria bacterium]|nr:MFS transporter [Alphaproteobacteria bacterium]